MRESARAQEGFVANVTTFVTFVTIIYMLVMRERENARDHEGASECVKERWAGR